MTRRDLKQDWRDAVDDLFMRQRLQAKDAILFTGDDAALERSRRMNDDTITALTFGWSKRVDEILDRILDAINDLLKQFVAVDTLDLCQAFAVSLWWEFGDLFLHPGTFGFRINVKTYNGVWFMTGPTDVLLRWVLTMQKRRTQ